jgi:cold shock CspA family protein/ribosome-associated translation inhibitor RaiA
MRLSVQIAFHNLRPSEEIDSQIRAEAERLEDVFDRITSCRVVVDVPHRRRHREGKSYQVRIDLKLPGQEIVINRELSQHGDHRDLDIAVRDAFDEARRQLDVLARVRRGDVKAHAPAAHGRVLRLIPGAGYGFLETPDGREIYFHRNSVRNGGFGHLEVGTEVAFSEEEGDKGPQATTVRPVGRHGHL